MRRSGSSNGAERMTGRTSTLGLADVRERQTDYLAAAAARSDTPGRAGTGVA
jgi:hypothetical protein